MLGLVQMIPTMLDQTDSVATVMESAAHRMSTAYSLSVYNCVKLDEAVFWQENVLEITVFPGDASNLYR